jgi:hypothetical protein
MVYWLEMERDIKVKNNLVDALSGDERWKEMRLLEKEAKKLCNMSVIELLQLVLATDMPPSVKMVERDRNQYNQRRRRLYELLKH